MRISKSDLLLGLCAATSIEICAQHQTACAQTFPSSKLPPGQYQYLGPSSTVGTDSPKPFVIDSAGTVYWNKNAQNAPVEGVSTETTPTSNTESSVPAAETYDYPLVKWKGKRLEGTAKASAWLTTTYEGGLLKYQVTLQLGSAGILKSTDPLEKAARKSGLIVELLDSDSFKLADFTIPGYVLHETANSSILEGRGSLQMPEYYYKKARDVVIR